MKHEDKKPENEQPVVAIHATQLLEYLCHVAQGNLTALIRITAVCEYLRKYAEAEGTDPEAREHIRKAVGGLGLAGLILAKQGKDLSDHEDIVAEGSGLKPVQPDILAEVLDDHAKVGKKWLETNSQFHKGDSLADVLKKSEQAKSESKPDADKTKPKGRGLGDNWTGDGRLN